MKTWNAVKIAKAGYIIMSTLFCAGGLLLFLYPCETPFVLCHIGGGLMILGGIVKLGGYFSKDLYRLAFQFDLAYGLLLIALGLIMIFRSEEVIAFLHFLMGIILLSDGLFKIQTALDARRFGLAKWWLISVFATVTGAFGLLLIINPFKANAILMAAAGIGLLSEGLLNLFVAAFAVKVIGKKGPEHTPEVIDIP